MVTLTERVQRSEKVNCPPSATGLFGLPGVGKTSLADAIEGITTNIKVCDIDRTRGSLFRADDPEEVERPVVEISFFENLVRAYNLVRAGNPVIICCVASRVFYHKMISLFADDITSRGIPFFPVHLTLPQEEEERIVEDRLERRKKGGDASNIMDISLFKGVKARFTPFVNPRYPLYTLDASRPINENRDRVLEIILNQRIS